MSRIPAALTDLAALIDSFPPDAAEAAVPDVESATQLLRESRPDLFAVLAEVRERYLEHFGHSHQRAIELTGRALALSFVRMATRHGSWGNDHHHYHNEAHALELLNGRLARVRLTRGWDVLDADAWLQLSLFATCHDLRQREVTDYGSLIGNNEKASIAEAHRILLAAGFDRDSDADYFFNLGCMIAGSTFDARPAPFNTAEAVSSGGSLAPSLVREIRATLAPDDRALARTARLMLIAADLDTANVGEPYLALAGSSVRLVLEREMRSQRSVDSPASAIPVFEFLTVGQERYFFDLHRFVSDLGQDVFGQGKDENAPKVGAQTARMRAAFEDRLGDPTLVGRTLIQYFLEGAEALG